MKLKDIHIDVVQVYDRSEHIVKTFHIWKQAGSQMVEWWVSDDGKHHAIYWPDAYYDATLQERRETGNMITPQNKSKRLIFIDHLTGQIDLNPGTFFEVTRSQVNLKDVAENMK